jgi:hypothetical protein
MCGSNAFYNSVEWKLRDEVEWSVDVEAEFFIQSLGLSLDSINIFNFPSLVSTIMSIMDDNSLTFNILRSSNIETSVSLLDIAEVFIFIPEDLEPS